MGGVLRARGRPAGQRRKRDELTIHCTGGNTCTKCTVCEADLPEAFFDTENLKIWRQHRHHRSRSALMPSILRPFHECRVSMSCWLDTAVGNARRGAHCRSSKRKTGEEEEKPFLSHVPFFVSITSNSRYFLSNCEQLGQVFGFVASKFHDISSMN